MMQGNLYERYQRQIILKNFGESGQEKLLRSSVLVVGAGGLGCPALQYLTAAGIGRIGIIDDDTIHLHNLHRQVLFTTNDIGLHKAEIAASRLKEMNPDIEINSLPVRLTNQNALELLVAYDIILDATDNFATRYMINDACVLLDKPLIFGAISQYEGQVAIFNCKTKEDPVAVNYRDLFPDQPSPGSVLNCAEAGVLGVLPGIIGTLQATEVIKLITGIGRPLINQLLVYDALTNESFIYALSARSETTSIIPQDADAFMKMNYNEECSASTEIEEINSENFRTLMQDNNTTVIDVREQDEQPVITEFEHIQIPLSQLKQNIPAIENETIVLICQSGKRSKEAAKILTEAFGKRMKIYSLKGGITHWKQDHHGKEKA